MKGKKEKREDQRPFNIMFVEEISFLSDEKNKRKTSLTVFFIKTM
jgi:hypothetical protein